MIDGVPYAAGVTADLIYCIHGSQSLTGYTVNIPAVNQAATGFVSIAMSDGSDGGFPVFMGANAVTDTSINITIDEDTLGDSERKHTTEQVSYSILGN